MGHASYLDRIFYPEKLSELVDYFAIEINKDKEELDINSIAVIGVSGCVIGGALSLATGLPLIIVRKKDEKTHSFEGELNEVEYISTLDYAKYIFVDDVIDSGSTVERVNKIIGKNFGTFQNMEKIYLYSEIEDKKFYEISGRKIPVLSVLRTDDIFNKE
jgi:adenine/guanine phosphoribosyltransferase-like PRPP-binding protein